MFQALQRAFEPAPTRGRLALGLTDSAQEGNSRRFPAVELARTLTPCTAQPLQFAG